MKKITSLGVDRGVNQMNASENISGMTKIRVWAIQVDDCVRYTNFCQ